MNGRKNNRATESGATQRRLPWRAIGLVVAVVAFIVLTFIGFGAEIDAYFSQLIATSRENRLAVAVVLFAALASDVFLPIPSNLVATACGVLLGFVGGFLLSFSAMCLSSAIGYTVGRASKGFAKKLIGDADMDALTRLQTKRGAWFLIGLRPVPVLSETSVIFAGVTGYPVHKTITECLIGNAYVSALYAATGTFFPKVGGTDWAAFVGAMVIAALFFFVSPKIHHRGE